jgi:hypothetical protein
MAKMDVSPGKLKKYYAASGFLDSEIEKDLGLLIRFDVYLQDPLVAEEDPRFGFDEECLVKWEPGITDGPTSARFVVVDYNGDTGTIACPAEWDSDKKSFLCSNCVLSRRTPDSLQFHQVSVWAALQRALDFYENGFGLGRAIPWGFEGNRLIVVPHAGYGKNAFYDRKSKSLQFYYFDYGQDIVHTCLSTDIINHEFGHAILDGIRPYYLESCSLQTSAFHEFVGDLTAILIILRNNDFRRKLAEMTAGNISAADHLAHIAEQFGRTVEDRPYLRTARSKLTMAEISDDDEPHHASQVLTGAMYEIIKEISQHYLKARGRSPKQAFWDTIQRMQRMALQPLDLLPPVDVSFKDYALAALRAEELSNPKDPYGYIDIMRSVFHRRGILDDDDVRELARPRYLYDRLEMGVFHDIDRIASSRSAAHRFLNDNRKELYIPQYQDFVVADLYGANKLTREARRLPRQIILEYLWREDVRLDGPQFGRFNGQITSLLCGGTLVFDENGNILSWFRKPGTEFKDGKDWEKVAEEGEKRREALLADIARQVERGRVGLAPESERGLLGTRIPPVTAHIANGTLQLEMTPHMSLSEVGARDDLGDRRWEISF